jgi:hypothetical protein
VRRGAGRGAGVGQPAGPCPGRVVGQDPEVVGGVEGDQLADQGTGQGADPGRRAGEGQDAEPAERDDHRGAGEQGRPADQVLGRREQLGVVVGEGTAGRLEPHRGSQRHRAPAGPDGEEVGVGRAALPEAVAAVDRRPQPGQVGMEVVGHGQLGGGQPAGRPGDPVEVGQVAGPFPAPGPAGLAALDQVEAEAGRHRGGGPADRQGDQPSGSRTGDREQERHRAPAADQRDQVRQPPGGAAGGGGDRRRGCDGQLAVRQRPRVRPHRPVHHHAGGGPGGRRVRGGRDGHARTLRPRRRPGAAARQIVDNSRPVRGA